MHDLLPLTGRAEELAALRRSLSEALAARGQLWLLSGEPGIGKTRLVEEVAAEAAAHARVLFGCAWEAGGAPAYWPWTQVLRQLLRELGEEEGRRVVAGRGTWLLQVVPELGQRMSVEPPPALDPDHARFQLMDSMLSVLRDAAQEKPVLLVLEDLHAADPSSVLLLDFLGRELRGTALMIMATYREAEARGGAVWPLIVQLKRHARVLPLRRLGELQVREVLEHALSKAIDDSVLRAVYRSSEGNPLFVAEMARWLETGGDAGALPEGVRGAIRARLGGLPAEARDALGLASVIGRDFGLDELELLGERTPAELAQALRPALEAGLVAQAEDKRYRFSHHCICEVTHEDLPEARRWRLHETLAEALETRMGRLGSPSDAEIAHHLLEAGPGARRRALDACQRAAQRAFAQLAFDDAALAYEKALNVAPLELSPERRAALSIGLGQALTFAGNAARGRGVLEQALAIARQSGDPELFARAALALGSELMFAEVDPTLVGALREALSALGREPSPLRAEVMARLSAAMQPARDPAEPVAMAREAIEMARQVGDDATLLSALRNGCSALMDLVDAAERLPLNTEMARLAQRLGSPLDALRAAQRLAFDHVELGEHAQVSAAVETCEALGTTLTHPVYRARALALRAMLAIHEGRFDAAQQPIEAARQLAAKTGDRTILRATALQRMYMGRLRGDSALMRQGLAEFETTALPRYIQMMADVLASDALAEVDPAAGRARLAAADAVRILGSNDPSMMEPFVYACDALGEARWLDELYAALAGRAERFVSWGAFGMLWGPPVLYLLGVLERLRGHPDEAVSLLERAEQRCRSAQAQPHALWCAYERARALEAAGRVEAAERTRAGVVEQAIALGMNGLARLARPRENAASAGSAPPASAATLPPERRDLEPGCTLARDGETWTLGHAGRQLRLKDSKGVRLLARLLAEPAREFHVLDLSDAHEAPVEAGLELIDAQARADYSRRARELREDVLEAEGFGDQGRAERLRSELDQITAELARAMGLGGRHRKAGDAAERARVNVQRRLRDAIERIRELDPGLGKHFDRSIRTGTFCSYDPG